MEVLPVDSHVLLSFPEPPKLDAPLIAHGGNCAADTSIVALDFEHDAADDAFHLNKFVHDGSKEEEFGRCCGVDAVTAEVRFVLKEHHRELIDRLNMWLNVNAKSDSMAPAWSLHSNVVAGSDTCMGSQTIDCIESNSEDPSYAS